MIYELRWKVSGIYSTYTYTAPLLRTRSFFFRKNAERRIAEVKAIPVVGEFMSPVLTRFGREIS